MKALEVHQMEQIEGGDWLDFAVAGACTLILLSAVVSTGGAAVPVALALGPSVCLGGGAVAIAT